MSDTNNSSNTETRDAESMKQKYNAKVARWPSLAQPWTIHRVPHSIRAVDKDAYEPKMLSIGPYHQSNPNLQPMEDHKWRYVEAILRRNPCRELSDYLEEMKGLEVEVRNFYSENIEILSKEFVEMMLFDGCFIVELFLNVKDRNATAETDDPIYSTKWILPIIRLDMLLLENQLPFVVVEHIFQLVNVTNTGIVELALQFFEQLIPMKNENPLGNSIPHSTSSIHHLLHLYHQHLLPTPPQSDTTDHGPLPQSNTTNQVRLRDRPAPHQGSNTSIAIYQDNRPVVLPPQPQSIMSDLRHFLPLRKPQSDTTDQGRKPQSDTTDQGRLHDRPVPPPRSIMSASDLRHYLRLRKKKNASSLLDVNLKGGCLEIPTLWINHSTNSVLRNLIAWEQCYPKCGTQFTSYAFFMDCLIDSPKDVEILKHLDIIEHWLGNNEAVALLFNQMCIGITYDYEKNFLSDLFKQVLDMKRRRWTKWQYILRRDYFSESWNLIHSQIAIMTVYLAIAQILIALFPPGKKNS